MHNNKETPYNYEEDIKKKAVAQEHCAVGKPVVDIKGKNINGEEIALSDFVGKGNVVFVDFWASWCGPCIRSLPELISLYGKYKDKGVQFISVSLDSDPERWKEASKKHQVTIGRVVAITTLSITITGILP